MTPPVALSIAGSDSSGGAGIQADLLTFGALGVLGATAVTCITVQNTTEVRDVHVLPAMLVRSQVEAVLDDLTVGGAKTGLLGGEAVVKEVAAVAGRLPALVVDPVLAASSGRVFADEATVRAYREQLFPVAAVVTPNLPEASALLGRQVRNLDEAREAARQLGQLAACVVVKGGHGAPDGPATDVVWDGERCWELSRPRVSTVNTHGGGCTFSAAIAAGLALGLPVAKAIVLANDFVHTAITASRDWRVGAGPGPIDHFSWRQRK
jgi:hydroxymethylpyrimidine/phosphomethylpyrimidine kinase